MTTNPKPLLAASRDILTPEVRLSYPSLFQAKPTMKGGDKLAFQTVLLLPPTADLKPFHAAMKAAIMEKFGKLVPVKENPIHDCAEKEGTAGYEAGWHYINVKSPTQPAVVDRRRVPVTDETMVYAGMWVRAYLQAYAWDFSGKKGVSFGLQAIQLIRDDTRLDGRRPVDPNAVFSALDAEDTAAPGGAITPDMNDIFG